ncbi:phage repressor protein CI [Serratia marcescens]|nr:phage repressor protein CI [Serratia marcescens]
MSTSKYPNEIKINPNMGGRVAIERLVQAYGFSTRQALADHLDVSKSTLANRYMRDTFPADWIIQCTLETSVSLRWLVTGEGPMFEDGQADIQTVKRQKIIDGKLYDSNYYIFDKALIPNDVIYPLAIMENEDVFIIDKENKEISNGKWIVRIEGEVFTCELTRIPIGRVRVTSANEPFECSIDDIEVIGKISLTIKR